MLRIHEVRERNLEDSFSEYDERRRADKLITDIHPICSKEEKIQMPLFLDPDKLIMI